MQIYRSHNIKNQNFLIDKFNVLLHDVHASNKNKWAFRVLVYSNQCLVFFFYMRID